MSIGLGKFLDEKNGGLCEESANECVYSASHGRNEMGVLSLACILPLMT
jgi:hypothetical protein